MLCHHSVVRMKRPIGVETWGSVPNQIGRSARAQRHRLVVNVRWCQMWLRCTAGQGLNRVNRVVLSYWGETWWQISFELSLALDLSWPSRVSLLRNILSHIWTSCLIEWSLHVKTSRVDRVGVRWVETRQVGWWFLQVGGGSWRGKSLHTHWIIWHHLGSKWGLWFRKYEIWWLICRLLARIQVSWPFFSWWLTTFLVFLPLVAFLVIVSAFLLMSTISNLNSKMTYLEDLLFDLWCDELPVGSLP